MIFKIMIPKSLEKLVDFEKNIFKNLNLGKRVQK